VIGDASIASGMAFEGLNHAWYLVILNDNAIGLIQVLVPWKIILRQLKTEKSEAK
jgi:1-deoxy-D-xylulose-5-phosphate synthase